MTEGYLLFLLSGRTFGVKLDGAIEILPWRSSRTVPLSYSYVEGLLDYRGTVYPVFNLRHQLGLVKQGPIGFSTVAATSNPEGQSIILLAVNKNPLGIVVDSVVNMAKLADPPQGQVKVQGVDPKFVRGIAFEGNREIMILDAERLLHAG